MKKKRSFPTANPPSVISIPPGFSEVFLRIKTENPKRKTQRSDYSKLVIGQTLLGSWRDNF